jgi:hypothetical protein
MNNSNEVIISGKSYELPDNKVKFTTLTDLIEAKDFAITLTKVAYFWGAIYFIFSFIVRDIISLVLGIYFIVFALISRGKYSPKYFLSHAVVITLIACLNIINIFFMTQSSSGSRTLWVLFALYQLWYSHKTFRLYQNNSNHIQKLKDSEYESIKSLLRTIYKTKPKNESNVLSVSKGFSNTEHKVLYTKKLVILMSMSTRKITVYSPEEFRIEKLKKVPLEKKYRVNIETNNEKGKGVMLISEYEKYLTLI